MALIVKDRVQEISTTVGTGTLTLGGAVLGFQSFAAIGGGNTTYYAINDPITGDWEAGIGTYTASGTTLSRDTVLSSSNGGSLVSFVVGAKNVFCTYPSERAVYLDSAGSYPVQNTFDTLNATTATLTAGTVSTTPSSSTDIANKQYVDTLVASGIHFHQPVRVESPINLNATYNNGTAGVGATLTNAGTQVALVIDGVAVSVADRVLVYAQTTQIQNGIYVVSDIGSGSTNWVLTRASDADTYVISNAAGLSEGSSVFVQQGATGAGETYTCNTSGVITFGTTNITFAQISSAQIYSAGTGLALSGTTFSIANTAVTPATYGTQSSVGTFTVNAQGQITNAVDTAIAISSAAVSGLAASATTDTTNANNITSGTLGTSRLSGSYTGVTGVGTLTAGTWNANTIAAIYGGTGFASYTVGDILFANTSTSLGKLAGVAVGNALISGGVGVAPSYGKVGLTTHVTGTLPAANGGTGITSLGTGVATALGINVGTAGAFVVNGGALGTPSSGTVTNLTGTASININGTVGATTPAAGTFTSLSDSGNLTFTGTGNRITGDFSNATIANRVMFQTSTVNGNTNIHAITNGTGTVSSIQANNSSDPANGSQIYIAVGASVTQIAADKSGTGTYLPMTFYTGGSERMRIGTDGAITANNASLYAGLFRKANPSIVAFTKTGNETATTSTTLQLEVNNFIRTIASGTSITMPTLTAGTDYAIWAKTDGTLEATSNHTSPPSANARKVGGFHYAPGGHSGSPGGGNTTPGIWPGSFWDLKFRPVCDDPRGMEYKFGVWMDMYLTGLDAITNGSSRYNVTMADGSSPPKIPTVFGGNGTTTYGSYTWFEAAELASYFGKRLPTQREFMAHAYGTTEASSIGTDQVSTILNAAYTSAAGLFQATGVLWIWADDRAGPFAAASWNANTEGRGSEYNAPNAALLGGAWTGGSVSGSRCSVWNSAASVSGADIGSRFCCDHLQLD